MPRPTLCIQSRLDHWRTPRFTSVLQRVVTGSKPDSIFLVFEYAAHDLGRLLDSMPTPFTESEVCGWGTDNIMRWDRWDLTGWQRRPAPTTCATVAFIWTALMAATLWHRLVEATVVVVAGLM